MTLHWRVVLTSTALAWIMLQARVQEKEGIDTVDFPILAKDFQFLVRQHAHSLPCPRGDELLLLLFGLCQTGLVAESPKITRVYPLFALAVPTDEVRYALRDDPLNQFFRDIRTR